MTLCSVSLRGVENFFLFRISPSLGSVAQSVPVLIGQSRSRCEGPVPAGSGFTYDKTEEILNDTGILSVRSNID